MSWTQVAPLTVPGARSRSGNTGNGDMMPGFEELLTPAEVALLFQVDPKTVTRWAQAGKLSSVRTLGGHRRYSKSEVMKLLADSLTPRKEECA
jgi:excisionase family DNA binding protein